MTSKEPSPESGGYILIDRKKCQGCMSCMLSCSLVHEGEENLSLARIQVMQNSFDKYPDDISVVISERCDLCAGAPFWSRQPEADKIPACVAVCPVGAIRFFDSPSSAEDKIDGEVNFRGTVWKKIGYPID